LAECAECLQKYESLSDLSESVSRAVERIPFTAPVASNERLRSALESQVAPVAAMNRHRTPWIAALLAAAAALVIVLLLRQDRMRDRIESQSPATASKANPSIEATTPIEPTPSAKAAPGVERTRSATVPKRAIKSPAPALNESEKFSGFVALPYSIPSLPVENPEMLRVQMRLSSLAKGGVVRMPPGEADPLVQADVLIGMDGEPYAIRLVSEH
jgi:hypothetical protein